MHQCDSSGVIQGESFLPSQWRDKLKSNALTPEQVLLYELMVDAIQCYQRSPVTYKRDGTIDNGIARLQSEAEQWIFADVQAPFTFLDVCVALDLDAEALRKRLREWKNAQTAAPWKIERTIGKPAGSKPRIVRDYHQRKSA